MTENSRLLNEIVVKISNIKSIYQELGYSLKLINRQLVKIMFSEEGIENTFNKFAFDSISLN